jgi:hypothetical protein
MISSKVLRRRHRSETGPLTRERAKRTPVTSNVLVRLVVSARVLAAFSSNPLIPLGCVDVSRQDRDGGGQ